MKPDISTKEDIELIVNDFYGTVQQDGLIGPVFNRIIGNRWPEHLSKMYSFWESLLLGTASYSGRPFLPHARLPLEQEHFDLWLALFHNTVDLHFEGPVATEAKMRAEKMAALFLSKITYLKQNPDFKPLL